MKYFKIGVFILIWMLFASILLLLFGSAPYLETLKGNIRAFNFFECFLYCFNNTDISIKLLVIVLSALFALIVLFLFSSSTGSGTNTKRTIAGDGQHGTADWISEKDIDKNFKRVDIDELKEPGFVVGYDDKRKKYLVDTSDSNMALVCPPGFGKSRRYIIPSILMNAMIKNEKMKPSMVIMDAKGDLYNKTAYKLQQEGYRIIVKNLRNPINSNCSNDLQIIIDHIKKSKQAMTKEEEKQYVSLSSADYTNPLFEDLAKKYTRMMYHKSEAEKYAKILSETIVKSTSEQKGGGAEKFFDETSKGLITALILLVSEFAEEDEAHIVSVFKLIVELNGLTDDSDEVAQKTKLEELFSKFPEEHRAKFFAGASIKADIRTSMNVFASALSNLLPLIDLQLEQIICRSSDEFEVEKFLKQPTAYFIIVPDEDRTKHFLATLHIRLFMNELIAYAENNPNENGDAELERIVLNYFDEFGNGEAIKDFDVLNAAARSRRIRTLLGLQSPSQLEKMFGKSIAKIIEGTLQLIVFSATAPMDYKSAKLFSDVLSTQTVKVGSSSSGTSSQSGKWSSSSSTNTSEQLMKRNLMNPDEIQTMSKFTFVALKSGCRPLKRHLPDFSEKIVLPKERHEIKNVFVPVKHINLERFEQRIIQSGKPVEYIQESYIAEYDFVEADYRVAGESPSTTTLYTKEEIQRLTRFLQRLDKSLNSDLSLLLKHREYLSLYNIATELMQQNKINTAVYEDFKILLKM